MSDLEPDNDINTVRQALDRERYNLLTAIGALAFLCICMFVGLIALSAYSLDASSERDAVSIALDDQRLQYYRCLRDQDLTIDCEEQMVSPSSRDIRRNLEGAGFANILYVEGVGTAGPGTDEIPEDPHSDRREAFGLLGRVVYGGK